jgi:hypothetical protein
MKTKLLLVALIVFGFPIEMPLWVVVPASAAGQPGDSVKQYQAGWKVGWQEGWKYVKGKNAYPPNSPYPPYPSYGRDNYQDGYNDGFEAGKAAAEASR